MLKILELRNKHKEEKILYNENYKTLLKKIKEETNKWKYILCSWIEKLNSITMFTVPKESIDSLQSLSKSQCHFFVEIDKTHLEIDSESQRTLNSQNNH